jgi:hypothetical protein
MTCGGEVIVIPVLSRSHSESNQEQTLYFQTTGRSESFNKLQVNGVFKGAQSSGSWYGFWSGGHLSTVNAGDHFLGRKDKKRNLVNEL